MPSDSVTDSLPCRVFTDHSTSATHVLREIVGFSRVLQASLRYVLYQVLLTFSANPMRSRISSILPSSSTTRPVNLPNRSPH